MAVKMTFEKEVKKEILELLDKTTDSDKFIVEKNDPTQRVLTFDGEEISFDEFGGVQKGSEVFIKDNLISLFRLSKR